MNLAQLREQIPALLASLGEDARSGALGPDAWVVHHGSAVGYVAILGAEEPEADPLLHVTFRIMRAPTDGAEAFFRTLLTLNHDLGSVASFSLDEQGQVWLGAGRFIEDLEPAGLREVIAQTAQLADRYDDQLVETFGRDLALE
ncbi:MAG: YbjN domain-containing protein [Gemmatimonadales bacterium]|jgi:hypothetical protein|nr:YbjN domain-containing protein [Gemmatimonadales bacterium]